jgi:hypothetical protein
VTLVTSDITGAGGALVSGTVASFNGRGGAVNFLANDLSAVGGALLASPAFTGTPTAPTPTAGDNSTRIATTAFLANYTGFAPIASPTFTGTPAAPTAAPGVATTQLATTAFVMAAIAGSVSGVASFNGRNGAVTLIGNDLTAAGGALLASPTFTGTPQAPTAAPGTANTQIATTAFVANYGGVTSFNTRIGAVVLTTADITGAGGAPLASPAFTGTPTAPTMAGGNSSTAIATTAFVMTAIGNAVSSFNGRTGAVTLNSSDISAAGGAPAASPVFSGTPEAPTPAPGNNSTQLATTAYVQAALAAGGGVTSFNGRAGVVTLTGADITAAGGALLTSLPAASTSLPLMNGSATAGASALYARGDHVHPSDTTRLALTGGTMTGAITVPAVVGGGLILNGAAGSTRSIVASTNSVNRWVLQLGNNTAETGSNAGSNIAIWACNDAGALLGAQSALAIVRASQTVALGGGLLSIFPGSLNPSPGVALLDSGGSSQVQIYYDVTNLWFICSYGSVWHRLNPSGNFQVAAAGSVQPGGGPWVAPSDDRIKTVTGDFDQGLEAVLALRPVTYVYNGNDTPSADVNAQIGRDPKLPKLNVKQAPFPGSDLYQVAKDRTTFVGFVAQELEAIAPSMVTKVAGFVDGQPVSDLRQVNTNNLVYMLINAVKALAAKVEALEAT